MNPEPQLGAKGSRLRAWWCEWVQSWEGYAAVYPASLTAALSPPLGEVARGQLELFEMPSRSRLDLESDAPFGPFADAGDRAASSAA